jgi:hypothetical protein
MDETDQETPKIDPPLCCHCGRRKSVGPCVESVLGSTCQLKSRCRFESRRLYSVSSTLSSVLILLLHPTLTLLLMALCTSPLCFFYFFTGAILCEHCYCLSLDVIGANVSCVSPPTRGSFIERWWYPLRVVSLGSHRSDLLSTAATTQMPHRSIRHPFMIKLWYPYHKCITHTKPTLSNRPDGPAGRLASAMMFLGPCNP